MAVPDRAALGLPAVEPVEPNLRHVAGDFARGRRDHSAQNPFAQRVIPLVESNGNAVAVGGIGIAERRDRILTSEVLHLPVVDLVEVNQFVHSAVRSGDEGVDPEVHLVRDAV